MQSDLHRHWPSETPAFDITFQASSSSLAIAVRLALPVIQNSAGLGTATKPQEAEHRRLGVEARRLWWGCRRNCKGEGFRESGAGILLIESRRLDTVA